MFQFKISITLLFLGWLQSPSESKWILEMKDAYLDRYDTSVIVVDWSYYSQSANYAKAHCSVEKVGKYLANLLSHCTIDIYNHHLIGHSLGAHVSGVIGHQLQRLKNYTIQRITGLDPAGPGFYKVKCIGNHLNCSAIVTDPERGLSKDSALFVDVYHTNGGLCGNPVSLGDVDVFMDVCGVLQCQCPVYPAIDVSSLSELTSAAIKRCKYEKYFPPV